MTDFLDRASDQEEFFRNTSIAQARSRAQEEPDEDEHGRYCLDCTQIIPLARVAAVNAVRCIHCQTTREKK
jgi:RNA polymerase-binding transcription factor DksA